MIDSRPGDITPEAWADVLFGALDAEDAAEYLGSSKDQFAKIAPEIPRVRVGKSFRYFRSDLLSYLRVRWEASSNGSEAELTQVSHQVSHPVAAEDNQRQFKPGRKPGNERTKRLI